MVSMHSTFAPGKERADARQRFFRWLQKRGKSGVDMPLRALLDLYDAPISVSAAYRVSVRAGLRGRRRNATRYAEFWGAINWNLPDRVLTSVWGVSRQTLRQRRLLTGVGPAVLACRRGRLSRASREAIDREWHK